MTKNKAKNLRCKDQRTDQGDDPGSDAQTDKLHQKQSDQDDDPGRFSRYDEHLPRTR